MKKILFILLAPLLMITTCSNETAKNETKKYTYLALGDSYTIGESVPEKERFPVQLADALNAKGIAIKNPEIVATTGWTTDELAKGIEKAALDTTYDLVTLLIGVNNQYRGRDLENYRKEYKSLLEQAIWFAGGHPEKVIVLSIPDWGVTPFAEGRDRDKIGREIDNYNSACKEITEAGGVKFLDITPISRKAAKDSALVADDGLHPSGKMYGKWVEQLLDDARKAIKHQ